MSAPEQAAGSRRRPTATATSAMVLVARVGVLLLCAVLLAAIESRAAQQLSRLPPAPGEVTPLWVAAGLVMAAAAAATIMWRQGRPAAVAVVEGCVAAALLAAAALAGGRPLGPLSPMTVAALVPLAGLWLGISVVDVLGRRFGGAARR